MLIELDMVNVELKKICDLFKIFHFEYSGDWINDYTFNKFLNNIKIYGIISVVCYYSSRFKINFYKIEKSSALFGGYNSNNDENVTVEFDYNLENFDTIYEVILALMYDELVKMYDLNELIEYIEYIRRIRNE